MTPDERISALERQVDHLYALVKDLAIAADERATRQRVLFQHLGINWLGPHIPPTDRDRVLRWFQKK